MKFIKQASIFSLLLLTLNSCGEASYRFKLNVPNKTTLGQTVNVKFEQLNGNKIDSVHVFAGTKRLALENNSATINTTELGVGKHPVTALAFMPGKVKRVNNSVEVFSNKEYDNYTYKIVNTFPHDPKAFTQGLEYHNGFLYETTGRNGQSWLRKVEIETGKVLQQYDLSDKYFGEGMTIVDNQIFWLTWQAGKGFIFDLDTFKIIKEFKYQKSIEGWGLTHSDTQLIKSDGTNKIWFLNPKNQKEERSIQVYTPKVTLEKLNELEYINGKIYANYWQQPFIAIINPENGVVDGVVVLKDLVKEIKKTQKINDGDDVLNGIAFDKENNRLFVTGKNWGKLFEIEIIKQ
ncbi:glutaminyl-peptide cyclotransferase [Tenacibaculum sp. 190524A05c]|uniref:Glutaminyl-peptide cyclotransferase n=1 Tax=Tenacibaculum platacis TaxID=3137852 RepID=A0ABM9P5P4_9FLAO